MPNASSTMQRFRAARLAFTFLSLPLISPPVAFGECVATELRGDVGGPDEQIFALVDARSDLDDLWLTLQFLGPENQDVEANLALLDEDRRIVEQQGVVVGLEPKSFVLPGVLGATPQRGFQLWVRLVDVETSEPLLDVPLQVGVACPREEACSWTVERDVATDAPLADQILMDLLNDLQSAGVDDPLGVLWDEVPELRGSVVELALRWQAPGPGLGSGQVPGQGREQGLDKAAGPGNACRCRWVAVRSQRILETSGHLVGNLPFHARQSWLGAAGYWAAQMVRGFHQTTFPARDLTLGFELVCGLQQGVRVEFVEIASRRMPVRIPALGACQAPCEGEVRHDVTAGLCADVRAFGREETPAFGLTWLEGRAWIGGQNVFTDTVRAEVLSRSQAGDHQTSQSLPSVSRTLPGNASYTQLEVKGGADLRIENSSAYVFASVASRPTLYLQANASCAETPTRGFYQGDGTIYGGGTVLERWGDPP